MYYIVIFRVLTLLLIADLYTAEYLPMSMDAMSVITNMEENYAAQHVQSSIPSIPPPYMQPPPFQYSGMSQSPNAAYSYTNSGVQPSFHQPVAYETTTLPPAPPLEEFYTYTTPASMPQYVYNAPSAPLEAMAPYIYYSNIPYQQTTQAPPVYQSSLHPTSYPYNNQNTNNGHPQMLSPPPYPYQTS